MDIESISKSLKRHGRPFLSVNDLSQLMGLYRGTVREMLHGLEYVKVGTKKMYHVDDISMMLMGLRENDYEQENAEGASN